MTKLKAISLPNGVSSPFTCDQPINYNQSVSQSSQPISYHQLLSVTTMCRRHARDSVFRCAVTVILRHVDGIWIFEGIASSALLYDYTAGCIKACLEADCCKTAMETQLNEVISNMSLL